MIGIDTNVLIRYIVQDDPKQSKIATEFVESHCSVSEPAFINLIILCELVWVLRRAYGYPKEIITKVLMRILETKEFIIESSDTAWKALEEYSKGKADFADYIISNKNLSAGCHYTITFDKMAVLNKNFKILKT